jgi:predicted DNA binding protein/putative methionine-R-sulfoxide reductase with GAF domain
MPDDLAAQHRAGLQRYLDTGERTLDWSIIELPGIHADGTEIPLAISFSEAEYDDQRFFTGIIRDITERKENEQNLKRKQVELARLNQFNTLVQDLIHAVVEKSTRTEIEQTVCDLLTDSDFYRAAWIGKQTRTANTVIPHVWSGIDPETDLNLEATTTDSPQGIAERAAETRDVCVVQTSDDESAVDACYEQLPSNDIESALAVPIGYEDALYSVLVVYAEQPSAFGDRQQASFADLGETIGLANTAAERKSALVADSILELTLGIQDPDQFFIHAAAEFGVTVSLEGLVKQDDNTHLEYFTLPEVSPEQIRELADRTAEIDHVRVVSTNETECLCEVRVTDSSIVATVAEHGGTVTDMTAKEGRATVRVELPRTADISRILDALETTGANIELQAKQTIDRPIETEHRFQAAVTDRLTDKQLRVIEAAYLTGFFEQPRNTTGVDIAESMGISPSTFHQHLRVGLQKLVGSIVETSTEHV